MPGLAEQANGQPEAAGLFPEEYQALISVQLQPIL
jgi:hypothetical protein